VEVRIGWFSPKQKETLKQAENKRKNLNEKGEVQMIVR
jgi:hypothetical protein